MKNSKNKIKSFLSLKKSFYRKIWQQNGYYPIEKFVWSEKEKAWEKFVQKTNGWKSEGCYDTDTVSNYDWWFYIFSHNSCILSYIEMKDNYHFNKN